ncbi:hypothetical protein BJ875DRAFT_30484 [Amylocarpus encephaloides]|uniref:Secreted protein n=1 Tax=Amylocarpus encephaloides TaxID=45428 RepID=A0A9P7YHI6_9HELO|nr:hypothetical protein BJ875DRAFT_30484 [Amylocarpus encephaloides]
MMCILVVLVLGWEVLGMGGLDRGGLRHVVFFSVKISPLFSRSGLPAMSIHALRKMLCRNIVTCPKFGLGGEIDFAFQYIPALDVITS